MKLDEAVSILRAHNAWRRSPAHIPEGARGAMGDPRQIGIAIDTVCDALSKSGMDRYKKNRMDLSHEIWAAAQLAPGEGIADGVARIETLLRRAIHSASVDEVKEPDLWRCTVCGMIGTVGRCCGEDTREPVNNAVLSEENSND